MAEQSNATTHEGDLVELMRHARDTMAEVASQASSMADLTPEQMLTAAELAADIHRLSEATTVRTVDAIQAQARYADPEDCLATRCGYRDAAGLLIALTGASRPTLKRWQRLAAATAPRTTGSTGTLPPLLPHLAQALQAGLVSVDQASVIRQHLIEASTRAHPDHLDAAEQALVASAVGIAEDESGDDAAEGAPLPDLTGTSGRSLVPLSPQQLGTLARAWQAAIDPDGPEPSYDQQRRERSFTLGRRPDGMWVGKMLLPPEQGEALRLALDAHNAPRAASRYEHEHPTGSGNGNGNGNESNPGCCGNDGADAHDSTSGQAGHECDSADGHGCTSSSSAHQCAAAHEGAGSASGHACGGGPAAHACADSGDDQAGAGDAGSQAGAGLSRRGLLDDRTTAQRQADTLVGLITTAMALPDAPTVGGNPAGLIVTITEAELATHAETGGGTAVLEHSGEVVPAHVAAKLICDGYLQGCVLDEHGLPLKLGRTRRLHTRHQRRAILTAYPGGCQNPRCDAPPGYTEIHHPIWWSQNGETDTSNGIPVCQHCHTEIHAGRLRCLQDTHGRWYLEPTYLRRTYLGAARLSA